MGLTLPIHSKPVDQVSPAGKARSEKSATAQPLVSLGLLLGVVLFAWVTLGHQATPAYVKAGVGGSFRTLQPAAGSDSEPLSETTLSTIGTFKQLALPASGTPSTAQADSTDTPVTGRIEEGPHNVGHTNGQDPPARHSQHQPVAEEHTKEPEGSTEVQTRGAEDSDPSMSKPDSRDGLEAGQTGEGRNDKRVVNYKDQTAMQSMQKSVSKDHDEGDASALEELQSPAAGDSAAGSDLCNQVTAVPKVALLFLTRGPMFHDRLWQAWLQAARGLIPLEQLKAAAAAAAPSLAGSNSAPVCGFATGWEAGRFAEGPRGARDALDQQFLFSLYVHPAPTWPGYNRSSVFHKRELPRHKRIPPPFWGELAMVDAELALMRDALRDPLNERFQLLSEDTIPMYPPTTIYREIMAAPGSHVTACDVGGRNTIDFPGVWPHTLRQGKNPRDKRFFDRVKQESWRKSSQWFMMTRDHVQTVVDSEEVDDLFRKLCYDTKRNKTALCVADEHYVPTALAHAKKDGGTTCMGSLIYTDFGRGRGSLHPRTFNPDAANLRRFLSYQTMDGLCPAENATRAAAPTFVRLADVTPSLLECAQQTDGPRYEPLPLPEGFKMTDPEYFLPNEKTHCVLFIRKFPEATADAVLDFYQSDDVMAVLAPPSQKATHSLAAECRAT